MSLTQVVKDPGAILPYSINWAGETTNVSGDDGWLQGETITASTWSVSGPDAELVIDSDTNSTTVATVVLSGGTANRTYTVTNRVTYAGGIYQDDRTITVRVTDR